MSCKYYPLHVLVVVPGLLAACASAAAGQYLTHPVLAMLTCITPAMHRYSAQTEYDIFCHRIGTRSCTTTPPLTTSSSVKHTSSSWRTTVTTGPTGVTSPTMASPGSALRALTEPSRLLHPPALPQPAFHERICKPEPQAWLGTNHSRLSLASNLACIDSLHTLHHDRNHDVISFLLKGIILCLHLLGKCACVWTSVQAAVFAVLYCLPSVTTTTGTSSREAQRLFS